MIVAVVQVSMPRRSNAAATGAQIRSSPALRSLTEKGPLQRHSRNGDAGDGGGYTWESREAAEVWYRPGRLDKPQQRSGARPTIACCESYATVDDVNGRTIVHGI